MYFPTPPRGKIHRPIAAEFQVRDIERPLFATPDQAGWADKIFKRAAVGGTFGRKVDGKDSSVSPIHGEERLLIFRRIGAVRSKLHSCGRADADVQSSREAVREVIRPLARPFAESEVRAADDVVDARGTIPGRAPVPFHVAVEPEKFSFSVEGDVVIIPLAGSEEVAVVRIRIHSENKTAGRLIATAEAIAVLLPAN